MTTRDTGRTLASQELGVDESRSRRERIRALLPSSLRRHQGGTATPTPARFDGRLFNDILKRVKKGQSREPTPLPGFNFAPVDKPVSLDDFKFDFPTEPQGTDPRFVTDLTRVETARGVPIDVARPLPPGADDPEEIRNVRLERALEERNLPKQFLTPPGATLKQINDLIEEQLATAPEPRSRILEAIGEGLEPLTRLNEEIAGAATLGVQALIPGQQTAERVFAEKRSEGADFLTAAREGFLEQDLPSVSVPVLPFEVPLPGGRSFQNVDIGVKGAIENVLDLTNLIPAVGVASGVGRRGITSALNAVTRSRLRKAAGVESLPSPASTSRLPTELLPDLRSAD